MKKLTIEICLTLRSTEAGGRKKPIWGGYHACVYFGITETNNPDYKADAILDMPFDWSLLPSQTDTVKITLLEDEHLKGLLFKNTKIAFREGNKIVAEGFITENIIQPQR
jgi:translation elongation factor EF-Tu-like GTPase